MHSLWFLLLMMMGMVVSHVLQYVHIIFKLFKYVHVCLFRYHLDIFQLYAIGWNWTVTLASPKTKYPHEKWLVCCVTNQSKVVYDSGVSLYKCCIWMCMCLWGVENLHGNLQHFLTFSLWIGLMQELSGDNAQHFFRHCYVHNLCPLAFFALSGRNLTPAELKVCTLRMMAKWNTFDSNSISDISDG